jgi:nicotinate-nucleotide pyrophosphorylase (carboxylating)
MGLYDMVLVKDNHIAVAGGIPQAIAAVDAYLKQENLDVGVEIETRTLEEVQEVISCIERGVGRVTRVLLDNMVVRMPNGDVDVSMLQSAVDIVNSRFETEVRAFIQPWVGFFGGKTINSEGRVLES